MPNVSPPSTNCKQAKPDSSRLNTLPPPQVSAVQPLFHFLCQRVAFQGPCPACNAENWPLAFLHTKDLLLVVASELKACNVKSQNSQVRGNTIWGAEEHLMHLASGLLLGHLGVPFIIYSHVMGGLSGWQRTCSGECSTVSRYGRNRWDC